MELKNYVLELDYQLLNGIRGNQFHTFFYSGYKFENRFSKTFYVVQTFWNLCSWGLKNHDLSMIKFNKTPLNTYVDLVGFNF